MENYEELMKAASLLATVSVDGRYWKIMEACRNTVIKVANAIKEQNDEINNECSA